MGLRRAWVCAHYYASYSAYTRGVSVLVHRSLPFQLLAVRTNPGGRYVLVHALIAGTPYVIAGVYLPPSADVSWLHTLMHHKTQYDVDKVLLVGDYNLVMSSELDRLWPLLLLLLQYSPFCPLWENPALPHFRMLLGPAPLGTVWD